MIILHAYSVTYTAVLLHDLLIQVVYYAMLYTKLDTNNINMGIHTQIDE